MAGALVEIRPCIERHPDGFTVSTKVKASDPASAPEQVTVWVWLMRYEEEAMRAGDWTLTRDVSALHSCRLDFGDGKPVQTCTHDVEPWAGEGGYTTAAEVRLIDNDLPPGWYNPAIAGTQAEHTVVWEG